MNLASIRLNIAADRPATATGRFYPLQAVQILACTSDLVTVQRWLAVALALRLRPFLLAAVEDLDEHLREWREEAARKRREQLREKRPERRLAQEHRDRWLRERQFSIVPAGEDYFPLAEDPAARADMLDAEAAIMGRLLEQLQ
jgi:hypothetical protein